MKLVEELTPPLRIAVHVGDIFSYRIRGVYRYFRVIDDVDKSSNGRVILYFYKATSRTANEVPTLRKEDLLIPFVCTWRGVLRDGFSRRVELRPLSPEDRYERHWIDEVGSFRSVLSWRERTAMPNGIVGPAGMPTTFSSIEHSIGAALGLIKGWEDLAKLPELPRPLLRKARAGQPGSLVYLAIPELTAAHSDIQHRIQKIPGFSKLARQTYRIQGWAGETKLYGLSVKKQQYQKLFELLHEYLIAWNLRAFWFEDYDLRDWLSGTCCGVNRPPL